jgi:ribosomal protein S6--L-glutamate ligase
MKLVSFNVFRTLGLSNVVNLKPELFLQNPHSLKPVLEAADWVLFPEYWQLNSLLYGMNCRIFPSEATYRIGHNKTEMTRTIQGLKPDCLPLTYIAANTAEEAERLWQAMEVPFVAKKPKASMGEGVWLIENRQQWKDYVQRTDTLYVQEYLPINRDLRIVWVGGQIIAAYWRLQSDRSFHTNVSRGGQVSHDDVPQQALDLVTFLALNLGLNHAGFDIAMVNDKPLVLEFNRLFGNQGLPDGGKTLTEAMRRYLEEQLPELPPGLAGGPVHQDVG